MSKVKYLDDSGTDAQAWIDSRPPEMRAVLMEFPPGTKFRYDGKDYHVIGFAGSTPHAIDTVIISEADPKLDQQAAMEESEGICLDCARACMAGRDPTHTLH